MRKIVELLISIVLWQVYDVLLSASMWLSDKANHLMAWMEVRGLCCDVHAERNRHETTNS